MSLLACLKRMLRSRMGNVSIIFALASPLVIGGAALSVETSYWYYKQHQLQAAADNAAYAASLENRNGSSTAVINAAALDVASQNTYVPSQGTITVGTPTSGPYANNAAAIQVSLTQQTNRLFTQFFSNAPVIIKANATAVFQNANDACILALDPSAQQAAYFSGSSALTLNGCVVMSNSNAANGVYLWGASSLTASCVVSAGGVQNNGGLTETGCSAPMTNVSPAPDPFRSLVFPSGSGSCISQDTGNLQPGVYCAGVKFHGNVNMAPGQYIFQGSLDINNNAVVTGSGVTFFMQGAGGLNVNGGATLDLSAPTSGPYSGILFFGNRSVTGVANTFNGTATSSMTGALYFPSQNVTYQGNFSGQNGCVQIVADTVAYSGNTNFNVSCGTYGMSPIPVTAAVKLVG